MASNPLLRLVVRVCNVQLSWKQGAAVRALVQLQSVVPPPFNPVVEQVWCVS